MNELTNITQHSQPTMSSREIAELCDKRHDNVMADIRTMCEQLNLDVLTFQHIYLDSMNLTSLQNTPTMSSREIATLCDKRHDNVMADIRKMLDELDIYAPDFSGTFITEQGNQYECFNLPKRECLILVSGYNVKIRTKIIDRWQQLNLDVRKFAHIYLDSMNLTLSMANFHCSKLSSAIIPLTTVNARELHAFLGSANKL